jgi:acetyl esterase/lipase
MFARYLLAALVVAALGSPVHAQGRAKNQIYGHKDGVARTMDVFTPKNPNGAGVIVCISFGFKSDPEAIDVIHLVGGVQPFLNRGYTVFAVVHGSQPKFTVPEIVEDIHLAVRHIKANAANYKIKPDRIGIAGGSSGGYLALMMGCDFKEGNPMAANAVERESSQVAAVACFFPVSDFRPFEKNPPKGFVPELLFPAREIDGKTNQLVAVNADRRRAIGTACSPIVCARKERPLAPTLIIHGEKDELIPVDHSKAMAAKLKACGGLCDLRVDRDLPHDLPPTIKHIPELVKWFDTHLLK